jgi:hypothetical protein
VITLHSSAHGRPEQDDPCTRLQDIQTETQAHEVRQLAEQTATSARIAELMQLVDPQQMVTAIASLLDSIHAGSSAADAVCRGPPSAIASRVAHKHAAFEL